MADLCDSRPLRWRAVTQAYVNLRSNPQLLHQPRLALHFLDPLCRSTLQAYVNPADPHFKIGLADPEFLNPPWESLPNHCSAL